MMVKRGEVWLATPGVRGAREAAPARPFLIVSPPEWNDHLRTVVVVPVAATSVASPFRPRIRYGGASGVALLDQPRTMDRGRLVRRLGKAPPSALADALATLQEAFAP